MHTWLPSSNYDSIPNFLDDVRLRKQRFDCLRIFRALSDPSYGFQTHPVVRMWRGYEKNLFNYSCEICNGYLQRINSKTSDECLNEIEQIEIDGLTFGKAEKDWYSLVNSEWNKKHGSRPPWYSCEHIFSSHRAALLAKNPKWYTQFNWTEEPKIRYFWPV